MTVCIRTSYGNVAFSSWDQVYTIHVAGCTAIERQRRFERLYTDAVERGDLGGEVVMEYAGFETREVLGMPAEAHRWLPKGTYTLDDRVFYFVEEADLIDPDEVPKYEP